MRFPSPDDLHNAPTWNNYVVAQAVQASLGLIPHTALAVGVRVNGFDVRLQFQLSEMDAAAAEDIEDIRIDLNLLLGDAVQVEATHELRAERLVSPRDGVRWIFLARDFS